MLYIILAYFGGLEEMVSSIWRRAPTVSYYVVTMGLSLGVLGLATAWMFQRDIVYPASFPAKSRERVPLPSQFGMPDFDDIRLETPDKVIIRGYLIKRKTESETKRAITLMYFHANAGNMGHRLPIARLLYDKLKCNVFMLSYRGYGLSDGHPSESGIKTDALTALEFLRSHPLTATTKIVAYGQSLGGAVAVNIVASNEAEFAGIILENTFLSVPKLIPNVIPVLKYFTFLASEKWESDVDIRRISNVPVLFLSGLQDDLVPPPHMRKLYELAKRASNDAGKLVAWFEFPSGKHNDTCTQPNYYDLIANWWNLAVVPTDPYVPTGRLGEMSPADAVNAVVKEKDAEVVHRRAVSDDESVATAGRAASSRSPEEKKTD